MGGSQAIDSQTPYRQPHDMPSGLTGLAVGRSAEVYALGDDHVLKLF